MKYFFSFVLLFLLYTTATTQSSNKRSKATSLSHVLSKRSFFIATGTLWCGAGNNAAKCEDLGEYEETDKCCREHDACPYTFTFNQPAYNGFYSDKIYSLSHCECDSLFYDCLHEQPYKSNSFVIWESFNSIGVKCFAYLPCSESGEEKDKQEEALWKSLGHRQTGNCSRGSRVAVFDSIFDYYSHLDEQLDLTQRYNVKQQLLTQSERFFSSRKRSFKCNYMFENLPRKMADNFDKNFIRKFAAAGANTTATTTTTTKESGLKTQSSTLAKMTNTNTPSPMKRVRRSAPTIRTDQHGHISLLEYPILVTCLILSFILFIGIYILILA